MLKIKNLEKVAKRIIIAIKNKEKIILYGDADTDGITSVIILKETIKNLKGFVSVIYFPDRQREGYGLNEKALKSLEKEVPALLFLLDCGIGNFKGIQEANKIGFDVIVIDHHEILGKLPEASIVVDPKQKGDNYPFKGLATAGIIYKLSEILLRDKFSKSLRDSFLELVALATLYDMMPKEGDNKVFIEKGLKSLERTFRPGLKAFCEINFLQDYTNCHQLAYKIISALSAGQPVNHLNEAYLLLTAPDEKTAKKLAELLVAKSILRRENIKRITEDVEKRVLEQLPAKIIFIGDNHWPFGLLGAVASKICQIYQKPIFIFKKREKDSWGHMRAPSEVNGLKAMESCSQYLKTYGGHPSAAGFSASNENLEELEECLRNYFKKQP